MSHICLIYHIIWRTKYSQRTITEEYEKNLYAYIFGICKEKKCTLFRINSMPDHVHMCVEIHPSISVSDFMKVIKQESSRWMKEHREWFPYFNTWGNGYAAFSCSQKDRCNLVEYIKNQKAHHRTISFKDEYINLLNEFRLSPEKDRFLED